MKYTRYRSLFIGLVHINDLVVIKYVDSACKWIRYKYIDLRCILSVCLDWYMTIVSYTLPAAYFACYKLAHDDGKYTNCMLQLLHRIDIDCFRFEFRFFSVLPRSLQIWVSIHVHISLVFVGFTNLQSFAICRSFLVLNSLLCPLNKMPSF